MASQSAWVLALIAVLAGTSRAAEDPPTLNQVEALNQVLVKARQRAEPAIACVLVSRSDDYRRLFQEEAPRDNQGRLGAFPPRRGPGFPAERLLKPVDVKKLDLSDPDYVPEAFGSGVVIDAKGLILTNYHLVRDASKIFVRLPDDKASYADIHAADPRSDMAVLRILDEKLLPLTAVTMGDGGAVEKGQWVISLANPYAAGFRDGSPSMSWGIISNLRRRAPGIAREEDRRRTLHHYGTLIQTDARLNLGVSGGALLNLKGEMIGLTSSLAALSGSETAGGFAIPLDAGMKKIVDILRRGEEVEYGFLGITLNTESRRTKAGVQIRDVTPGSPAHVGGLQPLDQILSVNGAPVQDNDEVFLALGMVLAGAEARLDIRSPNRAARTVPVTLAKFHVPGKVIASKKAPAPRGVRVDYTSVLLLMQQNLPPQGMGFRGAPVVQPGVTVREVLPNTPAATARLREGEVITHVHGQAVNSPIEFLREMAKLSATEPVELTLAASDWSKPAPKVTLN